MNSALQKAAKTIWTRHYGHPDLFDRCVARGGGDTGESEAMYRKAFDDARTVIEAIREPTGEQIAAALNASDGCPDSIVNDWLTAPSREDEAWKAIGGYPDGLHPSYASMNWHEHIAASIYRAMLDSLR